MLCFVNTRYVLIMSTLKSYSFVNTFKILIVFNLYYITINSDSNGDIIVKNL